MAKVNLSTTFLVCEPSFVWCYYFCLSNLHPFIHHTHRTHYHHITFACACCCILQRSYFFFLFLFVTPLFPTDIHALSRHKKWREKKVTKANSKSWKKIVCMNQDLKGWGCIMQNEPLRYESYLSGMQTKKSSSPEHIHTPCSVRTVLCCVPTLHYLLRSLHFTNTTKQTFPALNRSFQLYCTMCFVRSFMLKKGNKPIITIGSGKKSRKIWKWRLWTTGCKSRSGTVEESESES